MCGETPKITCLLPLFSKCPPNLAPTSDLFLIPSLLQWLQVAIVCLLLPATPAAQHPAFVCRHEPPVPRVLVYLPTSSPSGRRNSCAPDGSSSRLTVLRHWCLMCFRLGQREPFPGPCVPVACSHYVSKEFLTQDILVWCPPEWPLL